MSNPGEDDSQHIFVDFKGTFDSTDSRYLFYVVHSFGIPTKLLRLCRITLSTTINSTKFGTELFDTRRAFRQSDFLSCPLFNRMSCAVVIDIIDINNKSVSAFPA